MSILRNFFYNLDRAIASLFGAPPQETISSEAGRHPDNPIAEITCDLLSHEHCDHAVKHANALEKADDKFEG